MTRFEQAQLSQDGYMAGLRGKREPRNFLHADKREIWDSGNNRGLEQRARAASGLIAKAEVAR